MQYLTSVRNYSIVSILEPIIPGTPVIRNNPRKEERGNSKKKTFLILNDRKSEQTAILSTWPGDN